MAEDYQKSLGEVEGTYKRILFYASGEQAEKISLKDIKEAQGKLDRILGNVDKAQYQGVNIDKAMYYQVKFQSLNREFMYATKNAVNRADFSKRVKEIVFKPTEYGQLSSPVDILPETPAPAYQEGLQVRQQFNAPTTRTKYGSLNPGMNNPFRERIIP